MTLKKQQQKREREMKGEERKKAKKVAPSQRVTFEDAPPSPLRDVPQEVAVAAVLEPVLLQVDRDHESNVNVNARAPKKKVARLSRKNFADDERVRIAVFKAHPWAKYYTCDDERWPSVIQRARLHDIRCALGRDDAGIQDVNSCTLCTTCDSVIVSTTVVET
eukprot:PhM_4_TR16138/c1_g2_i5/m.88024